MADRLELGGQDDQCPAPFQRFLRRRFRAGDRDQFLALLGRHQRVGIGPALGARTDELGEFADFQQDLRIIATEAEPADLRLVGGVERDLGAGDQVVEFVADLAFRHAERGDPAIVLAPDAREGAGFGMRSPGRHQENPARDGNDGEQTGGNTDDGLVH